MSHLLVVSPTPTHPPTAGNRVRILNMMKYFISNDVDVFFVFVGLEDGDNYTMDTFFKGQFLYISPQPDTPQKFSFLQKIRNKIKSKTSHYQTQKKIDDWYLPHIHYIVADLIKRQHFNALLVEYVYMSKVFETADKRILKVLDTHDVMTDRDKKFIEVGLKPSWFYTTKKQEQKGLNRADVIIAINSHEAEFFKSITSKKVIENGHINYPVPPSELNVLRKKILFFASDNEINIFAIRFFIENVFPIVLKLNPDVTLILAGSVCRSIDPHSNIIFKGFVDDVEELYAGADIVINPVQFGTGLKIKNTEALAFSKPLITTTVGAEGLENGMGTAFYVEDSPEKFAATLINLLGNDEMYIKTQTQAYNFAMDYYSKSFSELSLLLPLIKGGINK